MNTDEFDRKAIRAIIEAHEGKRGWVSDFIARHKLDKGTRVYNLLMEGLDEYDAEQKQWKELEEKSNRRANKLINEFLDTLTDEEKELAKQSRIAYLKDQTDKQKREIKSVFEKHKRMRLLGVSLFARYDFLSDSNLTDILDELTKNMAELNSLNSKYENKGRFSQSEIERANQYPITNVIKETKKNYALCPFHDDKRPSFYLKNNFGYCFSCGKSANVITLYMVLKNKTFVEAVSEILKMV